MTPPEPLRVSPLEGGHTNGLAKPDPWCVLAQACGAPAAQHIGELK
jgi:hypothetical protein